MRFLCLFTTFFLTIVMHGSSAAMSDLNDYRWRNRLLLIFAPSDQDSSYQQINREISRQSDEIAERDLIILRLFESGASQVGAEPLSDSTASAVRARFRPDTGRTTAVLIGKDGGEKLRQQDRIDLIKIFSVIDAMPMRKQEAESKIKESRNRKQE